MATLGYTSVGATSGSWAANFVGGAGPFTATEDGTITSVSLYTGAANQVTLGVYECDGSNIPVTLVGDSAGGAATAGGWTTQAVSGNLESGKVYRIGFNFGSATNTNYDSPTANDLYFKSSTYSGGTLPDPFGASPSLQGGRTYSAYITYTPAATDAITLTTPADRQIFQRDGSDQGDIAITGTYTGTPTAIEASFNGGAWATIDAAPSGGNFSGTLSNQAAGQGTLEVRFTNNTGISDSASLVSIGDIVVIAGTSNAEGQGTNDQTYSHATLEALLFKELATSFAELADPTDGDYSSPKGSAWPHLATEWMASEGVPVAFITTGQSSTKLVADTADWEQGAAIYNQMLARITASDVDSIKAVIFHCGENDVPFSVTQANYVTGCKDFATAIAADLAGAPPVIMGQIGRYSTQAAADLDAVRLAQAQAAEEDAKIYLGAITHDMALAGDGVHFKSDAELQNLGRRYWLAVEAALFGGSHAHGPRFSSATYEDATITLTFDKDLDTDDTTYTSSAFAVTDDGNAATISSVTRTGVRTVDIVCDAALTGPVTVSGGSGNTGANATVPKTAAITLPSGATVKQPFEPFISETADPGGGGSAGARAGKLGIGIGIGLGL